MSQRFDRSVTAHSGKRLSLEEKRQSDRRQIALSLVAITVVWMALAAGAYSFLMSDMADSAVLSEDIPAVWPTACSLTKANDRFTLIMFIHPKCPCSSASLTELARLVTKCDAKTKVYAVFLQPAGFPDDWCQSQLWVRASGIPRTTAIADRGGVIAKLFNARTSGETVMYDPKGNLVFNGGITGARGHEGDNQGLDSVVAIVKTGNAACPRTKAYGCAL